MWKTFSFWGVITVICPGGGGPETPVEIIVFTNPGGGTESSLPPPPVYVFLCRAYPGDEEILESLKRLISGVITHPLTIGKVKTICSPWTVPQLALLWGGVEI